MEFMTTLSFEGGHFVDASVAASTPSRKQTQGDVFDGDVIRSWPRK